MRNLALTAAAFVLVTWPVAGFADSARRQPRHRTTSQSAPVATPLPGANAACCIVVRHHEHTQPALRRGRQLGRGRSARTDTLADRQREPAQRKPPPDDRLTLAPTLFASTAKCQRRRGQKPPSSRRRTVQPAMVMPPKAPFANAMCAFPLNPSRNPSEKEQRHDFRYPTTRVLIWDIPVRLVHWLLVLSFAGAWLTAESERWRQVHPCLATQWRAGCLPSDMGPGRLEVRAIQQFRARPRRCTFCLPQEPAQPRAAAPWGHNPAGALAIVALLALILITAATGWANLNDLGGAGEEAHELAAHALQLLVGVHLAGVLVSSVLHRENLVRSMLTGRKQVTDTDAPNAAIPRSRAILGAAVLARSAVVLGLAVVFAGGRRPRHCQHSRSNNDCGRERRKRREARAPRQTLTTATLATTPNMRILLAEGDNLLGTAFGPACGSSRLSRGLGSRWRHCAARTGGGTYDAMVLDLGLPGKDGTEVLADARRSGLKLPILVLTARDAVPDRIGHLDAGADDYIIKPVDLFELGPACGHWCATRTAGRGRHRDARLAAVAGIARGAAER